jgi:hypothetical protein
VAVPLPRAALRAISAEIKRLAENQWSVSGAFHPSGAYVPPNFDACGEHGGHIGT